MKTKLLIVLLSTVLALSYETSRAQGLREQVSYRPDSIKSANDILKAVKHPQKDLVLVAAHRGDWRNAPENSIQAVSNCIEMGVDIVEIDIRMTKDSALVVIHDLTLDRTTTGKGKLIEWTSDSIQTLYLKNGAGMTTKHRIPSLYEMMNFVKKKPVLLNLDKAWDYLPQVYHILKETGTINQAIFKGNEPLPKMREKWGSYMDSVLYMPMVWPEHYSIYKRTDIISPLEYTKGFFKDFQPIAFEVIYDSEQSPVFDAIDYLNQQGTCVWVNTLWDELCAGHTDDMALKDPDAHWGWVIAKGANIVQTDRPRELLHYLSTKNLRNNLSPTIVNHKN